MAWPRSKVVTKEVVVPEVPEAVKRALAEGAPGIDSAELLAEVLRAWGGSANLAVDLRMEFNKAQPGSIARQRILEMIQRLIINNTASGLAEQKRPADMGQEELEAQFARFAARILNVAPAAGEAAEEEPDGEA